MEVKYRVMIQKPIPPSFKSFSVNFEDVCDLVELSDIDNEINHPIYCNTKKERDKLLLRNDQMPEKVKMKSKKVYNHAIQDKKGIQKFESMMSFANQLGYKSIAYAMAGIGKKAFLDRFNEYIKQT